MSRLHFSVVCVGKEVGFERGEGLLLGRRKGNVPIMRYFGSSEDHKLNILQILPR